MEHSAILQCVSGEREPRIIVFTWNPVLLHETSFKFNFRQCKKSKDKLPIKSGDVQKCNIFRDRKQESKETVNTWKTNLHKINRFSINYFSICISELKDYKVSRDGRTDKVVYIVSCFGSQHIFWRIFCENHWF